MILELLALRRARPEERPAAAAQVGAQLVELAIDQEVLLLGTHGRVDALGLLVDQSEEPARLPIELAGWMAQASG